MTRPSYEQLEQRIGTLEGELKRLKQPEEAFKKSEEEFRAIFESADDFIFLKDRELRYVKVNPAMEQLFGRPSEDLVGRTDKELFGAEAAKHIEEIDTKVLNGEWIEEEDTKPVNGRMRTFHVKKTPVKDAEGQVVGLCGIARDVTESKLAEIALRESEERFRLLFDNSADAHILYEGDQFIDCNQAALDILGLEDKKELLTLHPADISPEHQPDSRPSKEKAEEMIALAFEKGSHRFEWLCRRPDGSDLLLDILLNVIRMKGEALIHGVWRDITDRKRAEEEIAKQKRMFETMFNTIPDGVVITNTRREIQLANKGMESTFGYKPQELLGKTTEILYADRGDYLQAGRAVFDESAKEEGDLYVTRYRNKAGHEFSGETFGAKLFDENGRWIGNLGVMRDITERKKLESQLRQTQKMEAIGTLAGGIAHDFNNILTPVIIQTELALLEVPDNSPMKNSLHEVLEASHRARDLVKQILTFSRRTETDRVLLTVSPIVKEALKLLRSTLPTTIRIEENIGAETGSILADPTQIHQVLMNLCTNAAHAMREKGGVLSVGLLETEIDSDAAAQYPSLAPGKYLRLSVGDTGEGMDPTVGGHIFEPFFTTKGRNEGTGMGLSVVHGIARSYGGSVEFETQPGKGTTFHVFFPWVESRSRSRTDTAGELAPGDEHILVVDDEKGMVDSIQAMLKHLGYKVTARTSSVEALEIVLAKPNEFDCVITDMTMPNMTGDHLAQRIIEVKPDMPIILCTGFSEKMSVEKAKAIGVKEFVMKPIVMKEMAETIRRVLDAEGKKE